MKKIIVISLIFIPMISLGQIGWNFKYISVFDGISISTENKTLNNFELLYDFGHASCISKPIYIGLGLTFSNSKESNEYGIIFQTNTTRYRLALSREIQFYPFVYIKET